MPHTPGFADAFGARQLVFDPTTSTSLEVLRFKREFSESPDFEGALLARVEAFGHFRHASLGSVQSVQRISDTELALVSRHTAGRRVSELLPRAHGPAFALELIRLVTPALAALHRSGEDVAHGALSAERIIVTRDGRLVVVEHVLGSALEALLVSRTKMIELGLVAPAATGPVQLSARTDFAQLGFIALALLLGRKLDPADYPDRVPALLDEFSKSAGSPILAAKLRMWLERAMQMSPRSFASADDAVAAIADLPDDADVQAATTVASLDAFPQEAVTPAAAASVAPEPSEQIVERRGEIGDRRVNAKKLKVGSLAVLLASLVAAGGGAAYFLLPMFESGPSMAEAVPVANAATVPGTQDAATVAPLTPDASAGSAGTPTSTPAAAPAPVTTPVGPIGEAAGTAAPLAASVAPAQTPVAAPAAATPAPAAVATRFGGLTVKSGMDLQVFENGSAIGSTAGPIAVGEGVRTIEFVNETLGFRFRQTVTIKAGQMTIVNIAVPNGRVSINAAPWAEVDIDGTPAGETPLANLSLPIGTHEITFRHPQLGTKKQTIVVKADGLTKVTQVFEPGAPR